MRISTFGQDGPLAARPGLDRVGIGYGGLMHLTGYPDRPPVRVGVTMSDYLTGVFSANAAVAALYERDARGGEGAVVDASLYGAVLRILEWTLAAYDQLGIVRSREGNRLANSAPLDNYPTADGKYVCIVAGSDANFSRLCKAMGRTELIDDERFARLADRAARSDEINERRRVDGHGHCPRQTSRPSASRTTCRWPRHTRPRTSSPTPTSRPEATWSRLTTPSSARSGSRRRSRASSAQPPGTPSGAPALGAHTREVLSSALGLDDGELDRLAAEGIT